VENATVKPAANAVTISAPEDALVPANGDAGLAVFYLSAATHKYCLLFPAVYWGVIFLFKLTSEQFTNCVIC